MIPGNGTRLLLIAAGCAVLAMAGWRVASLIRQDKCLDGGGRWIADGASCARITGQPPAPSDTLGCREAARGAVRRWFHAVETGDTSEVRSAISPTFAVISAGRNGWPEPFRADHHMSELFAYVTRRSGQHERLSDIVVPTGLWRDGRLVLGPVSYSRTADDVQGRESWLGYGVYECGRGIYRLGTAPQGPLPLAR